MRFMACLQTLGLCGSLTTLLAACGPQVESDDAGVGGSSGSGGVPSTSGGIVGTSGTTPTADPSICESCAGLPRNCGIKGSCSKEAACETVDCGGPIVSEDGCVRPECEQDAGCAEDARCASVPITRFAAHGGLLSAWNRVACAVAAVGGWMKVCSPTALSGQRGAWVSLRVQEWNYLAVNDLTEWVFRPDGSVEVSTYSVHESAICRPRPARNHPGAGSG